jgi:hypothetical protein
MNKELYVIFSIEDKSGRTKLYEREMELLPFQKEALEEGNGFFYHLKDSALLIEEKMFPKINNIEKGTELDEVIFKILYNDKSFFAYEISCDGLKYESFQKNEVEVFYFMEDIVKRFSKQLMEEHKKIALNNK